jgi:hypothetical protein
MPNVTDPMFTNFIEKLQRLEKTRIVFTVQFSYFCHLIRTITKLPIFYKY